MQAISWGHLEYTFSNDLQFEVELNIEANSRNIYKETHQQYCIDCLGCLIINSLTSVFECPSVYSSAPQTIEKGAAAEKSSSHVSNSKQRASVGKNTKNWPSLSLLHTNLSASLLKAKKGPKLFSPSTGWTSQDYLRDYLINSPFKHQEWATWIPVRIISKFLVMADFCGFAST